jgi:phosphoserine aminotransferase
MPHAGRPGTRPHNPCFSSGPCAKRPGWSAAGLDTRWLGRSHRARGPKAALAEVVSRSRALLGIPADWRVAIVPGSDTGAFEMALWGLLGPLPVDVLAFESFSEAWARDVTGELRLPARVLRAPYGQLPDLAAIDPAHDLVFCWNGTTGGVRMPEGWAPQAGEGLAICDATSAVFAMELPWARLDAVTWSWQKSLGGEGGHGMLALSPRAVARLSAHRPAWPMPKLFRLTRGQSLAEAIFAAETINTPSLLCVADALDGLDWAERIGGLPALIARTRANAAAVARFLDQSADFAPLAPDPAVRSPTSICLSIVAPWFVAMDEPRRFAAARTLASLLESEGAAYDIASHRDAPAGLRLWGGPTVETADLDALFPWLEWGIATMRAELQAHAAE